MLCRIFHFGSVIASSILFLRDRLGWPAMLHEPPQIGSLLVLTLLNLIHAREPTFIADPFFETFTPRPTQSSLHLPITSFLPLSNQLRRFRVNFLAQRYTIYPSPSVQHNGEKKGRRHFIRAVKALGAALLYCNPGTNLRFALAPIPLMHLSRRLATISRNFCDLLPSLPFQILLGMLGVLLEEHGTVYTVLLMRIAGCHFYKLRHDLEVATRGVSSH